jgi:acyl-CoA oxidase
MGDMGPKFGYESKDNGWLRFNNIRIPKSAMLSRFSRIDDEGNFEILGDLRVLYAVMMMVRLHIVRNAGFCLFRSLKVAVRYACVRR